MSIPNTLIVVVQTEPRDGQNVSLEKDFEAFKNRVVELDMVERESASEIVELGQTYWNDDDSSTIIGYEVSLPFVVNRWCRDCWYGLDDGYSPDIGDTVYFECVSKADCESCEEEE